MVYCLSVYEQWLPTLLWHPLHTMTTQPITQTKCAVDTLYRSTTALTHTHTHTHAHTHFTKIPNRTRKGLLFSATLVWCSDWQHDLFLPSQWTGAVTGVVSHKERDRPPNEPRLVITHTNTSAQKQTQNQSPHSPHTHRKHPNLFR